MSADILTTPVGDKLAGVVSERSERAGNMQDISIHNAAK